MTSNAGSLGTAKFGLNPQPQSCLYLWFAEKLASRKFGKSPENGLVTATLCRGPPPFQKGHAKV
eukprot:4124047-Amphidinium_carterae.2